MLDIVTGIRLVAAGQGEALDVLGASMVVKADPARDGMFVGDHVVPPGYFVPPHVHDAEDELFHILDGEITLITDAGERRAGPGDTVVLPRGHRHGFRNDTARPLRFLVTVTPGVQAAEMFRHMDRARPATPDAIVALCAQYGIRMG